MNESYNAMLVSLHIINNNEYIHDFQFIRPGRTTSVVSTGQENEVNCTKV